MVKQLSLKQAALSLAAVAALGTSGYVSAQGVDSLESKLYPNYVTDDMLLNADKDASNWLHYGRDYQTTRYSPLKQVNKDNVKKLRPVWNRVLRRAGRSGQPGGGGQRHDLRDHVVQQSHLGRRARPAQSSGSTSASCPATYSRSCAATW